MVKMRPRVLVRRSAAQRARRALTRGATQRADAVPVPPVLSAAEALAKADQVIADLSGLCPAGAAAPRAALPRAPAQQRQQRRIPLAPALSLVNADAMAQQALAKADETLAALQQLCG